jgi:folate-dependent phosphoribosylglycinamide formyltransferase PurN
MTEDLIEQADMLLKDFNSSGYISKYVMEVLPQLVAEIKRLQADNAFLHKFIDAPGSALEAAITECKRLQEQLATWQKIAIDEHATLLSFAAIISPPTPEELIGFYLNKAKEDKDKKLPIAAKELNLQVAQEAGYVDRLSDAFIKLYEMQLPTMDPKTRRQHAHAALEKIRKGDK